LSNVEIVAFAPTTALSQSRQTNPAKVIKVEPLKFRPNLGMNIGATAACALPDSPASDCKKCRAIHLYKFNAYKLV
jgi:hypothetical protein